MGSVGLPSFHQILKENQKMAEVISIHKAHQKLFRMKSNPLGASKIYSSEFVPVRGTFTPSLLFFEGKSLSPRLLNRQNFLGPKTVGPKNPQYFELCSVDYVTLSIVLLFDIVRSCCDTQDATLSESLTVYRS